MTNKLRMTSPVFCVGAGECDKFRLSERDFIARLDYALSLMPMSCEDQYELRYPHCTDEEESDSD